MITRRPPASTANPELEARWSLTARALDGLLSRLGHDRDAAAREYDSIRRKLVGFFARRDITVPETLADETIDRVARRLDEGENVEHLHAYFYGVARRVMQESVRRRLRQERAAECAPLQATTHWPGPEPLDPQEALSACLERCLERLPPESRWLIMTYYRCGAADRHALAASLGLTYSALKTQVHRLRVRLGTCVQRCLDPPPRNRAATKTLFRHFPKRGL
jgi:DNA-directed RNA polymerase specialized sigma24 family protein